MTIDPIRRIFERKEGSKRGEERSKVAKGSGGGGGSVV